MNLDVTKVTNLQFQNIDWVDYPDFSDAFISYGEYDGQQMTEEQIDQLTDQHPDFVYNKLLNNIF
jgi:hypothetical protein